MSKRYYYQFLETISKELAFIARELEKSIFTSPRTMLTHVRTGVEAIIKKVFMIEELAYESYVPLVEQLDRLNRHDLI